MNLLILTCLLCSVVCSAQGSETTHSGTLAGVIRGPGSGEGLQSSQGDDDEPEIDDDLSGGDNENFNLYELPPSKDEKKKRKGKGKKKSRHRSKATTSFNPEHTSLTSGLTSTPSTIEDPCTSTHLGYCIHGYCKHIEELREPVCICIKGYDGDRCGIQTLGTFKTKSGGSSDNELLQTVLVIVAVVLSVISCTAILLMTCAHYRSHKTYMASFLGTGAEQEKLQKPLADVMV
ncbi:proheparin-binding EGF-like growth factor [Paralichthys olivaceus]|uniref:proheparin-binding EGF-like growth factor n=1 Tax=Paralichthys olivaceus TaxID=8255 RepID=UPI00097D500E|nr:PREDICTED: proheparin-binding EGF-like growth factor [Paralichthys olivaceus]